MGLGRWLGAVGAALLATMALKTGETLAANANATSSKRDVMDRVVMLTTNRSDMSVWCMGLLIAPRAVLTYAHCTGSAQKPLAWAFFGRTREQFFQSPNKIRDGDVGDLDAWVAIVQTMVHPQYAADGSTPTMDLAVLQLQEPRVTTDAFSLVANMSELDAANVLDLEAFQMTTNFVTTSRDTKLLPRGTFRKVPWNYCVPSRLPKLTSWKLFGSQPQGQVCVVASVVEDRRPEQLTNTFVLLENKLVGLSVVTNTSTAAAHRFIFLSDQASFITKATQKTEVWMAVSTLVVGGKDTPTFQGYVSGLRQSKSGANFCLGSLIAPKFVLTAAHCVAGVNFSQVSVGSMYVATEIDGEQIKVKRAIVHPNYEAPTFRNDYAIVELEYISIQSPILLYNGTGDETAPGNRLRFYGYGPSTGNAPGQLQSVELPVVDKKQCMAVLQPPLLDDSMLCAGGEAGKDACHGDSGGPLVYQSTSPVSLVAMASFGRGCGVQGVPAVYALVATASSFIEKYVEGHRWITAYRSNTSPVTTTTPSSPSTAPAATPPMQTPTVAPSTPTATDLQEPRSGDTLPTPAATPSPSLSTAPSTNAAVLEKIETAGGWTPVPSISLKDTASSSLVVDSSYTQLTRDVLSSALLSTRSGLIGLKSLEELTKYAGASTIEFYASSGLDRIHSLISTFDSRSLRRRTVRFARGDDPACGAHR